MIRNEGTEIRMIDQKTCFAIGGVALLPRYAAKAKGKLTFNNSDGCNLKIMRSSHLWAPLASIPMIITSISKIVVKPKI